MKPVPHGKPYAGKLHVRFDEGGGRTRRGALRSTLLAGVYDILSNMRRCRINLPNRCCRLISRVTHCAFEGGQAANRKGYAAMTRKTYCGNLLW